LTAISLLIAEWRCAGTTGSALSGHRWYRPAVALFEAEKYPAVHTSQECVPDRRLVPLLPSNRGGPVDRTDGPSAALSVSGRQVLYHPHRRP
jgi:hypothetical protein